MNEEQKTAYRNYDYDISFRSVQDCRLEETTLEMVPGDFCGIPGNNQEGECADEGSNDIKQDPTSWL
ncbi:unnamed protein product [marine sediment metagenome]|uniref:Uncharacterized protein n=1 Tax=marine sediment metagenome TaxID=412755 RepID=X1QQF2_9ZZZZ